MEAINNLKEIKTTFTNEIVKNNLITAIEQIKIMCQQKNYNVDGHIDKIITDFNLNNSTLSSRKKLAKKIYYFMKKKSIRTMNALFSIIRKIFLGEDYKITIKHSTLEQEVIASRIKYRALQKEVEAARLVYKEKKKLFYPKSV